jgi:hypothetical protein
MRREFFILGLVAAGWACAGINSSRAATVALPANDTTLYLHGNIQNEFWMTFALDANIQLLPSDDGGYVSHYILNINLSNPAGTTAIQFAKIEGGEAENGLWPDGPPRLLFSDAIRTLHIDASAASFNALLIEAALTATMPEGLFFTSEAPVEAAVVLSENPIPAAAPLFASGLGAIGLLAWRRSRRSKPASKPAS